MLPRHPNCRCAWIPANVGEDGKDQTDDKKGITQAIQKSQESESGESGWEPGVAIDKKRPESILNSTLANFDEYLMNAFCPTGEGGGQDNSCSPGGSKGKSKKLNLEGLLTSLSVSGVPGDDGHYFVDQTLLANGIYKAWGPFADQASASAAKHLHYPNTEYKDRFTGVEEFKNGNMKYMIRYGKDENDYKKLEVKIPDNSFLSKAKKTWLEATLGTRDIIDDEFIQGLKKDYGKP